MLLLLGVLIPLVGTSVGSAFVFFMKNKINDRVEKILLGFSAGVMIAASIWSLILPSIEMARKEHVIAFLPASVGFFVGILFLVLIDRVVKKIYANEIDDNNKYKKVFMMILAITLHNIPEGMAVGISFAAVLYGNSMVTLASAYALSIGISIQNFPEGAIISMPLKSMGVSNKKSFVYGVLSGVVEPVAALFTLLLTNVISVVLPYLLSFAAGAMFYVVVKEIIPESQGDSDDASSIIGLAFGFVLMMILDVTLG